MSKQCGLLDLPNEILRDHILSQIEQHDLFWKIGLVCKRLLQLVFDMNKEIVIYKKEVFKNRRSLQKRQSLSRPSYLMKFHKDSFDEKEELELRNQLKRIFACKEVSQQVKSFSNIYLQPYYLQTQWEEPKYSKTSDKTLSNGVSVSYRAGYTPIKVYSDILVQSEADLNELNLNFSQMMECNYYTKDQDSQECLKQTEMNNNLFNGLLRRRASKNDNSESKKELMKRRKKTQTVFDDDLCRDMIKEFERIMIRFPTIRKLTILLHSFSNQMLHLLGEQIGRLKELRALSIGDLEEGRKRWGESNDIIKCVAKSCKKFQELHLSNIVVDHSSLHILSKISYSHITTLDFKYCVDLTDTSLSQLVGDFQNIFNLYISGCCPELTGLGLGIIKRCEYLRKLHLNRIGDDSTLTEGLQSILSTCTHLEVLYLSNYWNINFNNLVVHPSLSLQNLYLEECKELTDSGLFNFIGSCSTHLRHLSIYMCDGFTSEGLKSIGNCKHLNHLSLIRIQPFEIVSDAMKPILSGCSKLESLVISQSQLSFETRPESRRSSYDEEMMYTKQVLMEAILEYGQHLRKLELEHMLMGVPLLRRLVSKCIHLQRVDLCICNSLYVQWLKNTKDLDEQRRISRIKFNINDDCIFQFCSPVPVVMSEDARKVFSMFRKAQMSTTEETSPLH